MKYKILKWCSKNKKKTINILDLLKKINLFCLFNAQNKKNIEYILKSKNIFIYIKKDGRKIYNPKIKNLEIKFKGINNYIEINELKITKKLVINVTNNGKIFIGPNSLIQELNIYLTNGSELYIGENFSVRRAIFTLSGDYGKKIAIGDDCMFSYDLIIRTSDMHIIYDNNTKQLLNSGKDIKIGNHVWIAARALILKGIEIADNCIVGASSVVSKKFLEPNCIIAGNPAKVVKRDVNWHISKIHNWDKIKASLDD